MSSNRVPSAATNAEATVHQAKSRCVLGEVSPNVRKGRPSALQDRKPMAGSPLKRSFYASIEDGSGFTYLKKRKISDDSPLSQTHSFTPSTWQSPNFVTQNALPVPEVGTNDQSIVPTLQTTNATQPNSPVSSGNDEAGQDSAEERRSFSSLINYDPSSQTAISSQNAPVVLPKGPSHAELLKLRLRVAMYKVRTNQVDTPFENLHVDLDKQEVSISDVEEAVAALRREAQARMTQLPVPRLLPAPVLLPTAYSNRMVYEAVRPSSPPAHSQYQHIATPRRVSGHSDDKELTSSIIKGRVAEGLLGLKHAV